MKNIMLLSAFTALFLASSSIAIAQDDFDVLVSPSDITINITETGTVDILIINNQAIQDNFQVSIWPSTPLHGISPDLQKDKVKIAAGSNSSLSLYLSVAPDAEEIVSVFRLSVTSNNLGELVEQDINVRTRRKSFVYISDFSLNKSTLNPGECIGITTIITNDGLTLGTSRLQTSVKKGTSIVYRFDDDTFNIEPKSIETVTKEYCFDDYAPEGTYSVEVSLRDDVNKFLDTRTNQVVINEVSNPEIKKKFTVYTPFVQIKTITVKNEGNVIEHDFNVTESVSEFTSRFFHPVDEPTDVKKVNGNTVYVWSIESLAPGEEVEIKYEIRFIILWATGIGLAVVVFLAFTYVYKPKIKKTVRFLGPLKKGKETVVLLELKNSTINEINNIVVQDSVSPIATLVERFDTIAPVIKKSDNVTKLFWKIKSLKPLEERVLTYRIRPKVDIIGSMRLPRAAMQFTNKKKEIKTVVSKSIEIK